MIENLDRLKIFHRVFSLASVGNAAKSLHVTQPAVSQAISKLESEIQTQLFVRRHRHLIPTAAGQRLFDVVDPFVTELKECLARFEQAWDEPFGELRIGAPAEFGKTYLPAIMAAFRERHPNVTFYLEYGPSEALGQGLHRGELDMTLMDMFMVRETPAGRFRDFHFEPIVEEEVILACSRDYFDANIGDDTSFENLSQLDFIEYTRDTQTVEHWFRHHFGVTKTSFRTVMTLHSHDAAASALTHNTGLGVLCSHLVDKELKSGALVPVGTEKENIVNQISLVHLKDKSPTLTEKVFRQFLLKELQQLGF